MGFTRRSHCKVNLLLNILGRMPDGFHELETIMQPVPLHDEIAFETISTGIELTCSDSRLPVDATNLVHRATRAFLAASGINSGVRLHLEKRIPMEAGLGGGSGNAAVTLVGLNDLFGSPLKQEQLHSLAAGLGSDVPFFLQQGPALAVGRGEQVTRLPPFRALQGKAMLLIHPGFGVSTAWAYKALAEHPDALNGRPGRAQELITKLEQPDFALASSGLYNSLEAPVLRKHPLLALFQGFLRERGALATLMSGSGSTTFAVADGLEAATRLQDQVKARFGSNNWTAVVPL